MIREKDIAVLFNSSTTPVREAIKRLASEGFVEVHPYRQTTVSDITYKEYREINETMCVLDRYAHKVVIHELAEKDHQEFREMTDALLARDTSHISSIIKKHWDL